MANTKRDGSVRDPYEDMKVLRLFVIIPKTWNEDELKEEFSVSLIYLLALSPLSFSVGLFHL